MKGHFPIALHRAHKCVLYRLEEFGQYQIKELRFVDYLSWCCCCCVVF